MHNPYFFVPQFLKFCHVHEQSQIKIKTLKAALSVIEEPEPLPQPHGWVRLGLEVLRFPHFWVGGLACAEFPRGAEFRGSFAPFFSPHP